MTAGDSTRFCVLCLSGDHDASAHQTSGALRGGRAPGTTPTPTPAPPVRGRDGTRPGGVGPPAPPGRPIDAAQVLRDYERRNGASLTLDLRAALLAGADALDQAADAEQLISDLATIIGHLGGAP